MNRNFKAIGIFAVAAIVSLNFTGCSAADILGSKDKTTNIYSGTAEADKYNITSEIAGKIKELKIKEGQGINSGDEVAVLDSSESTLKSDQSQIALKNAQNELDKVNEGNRSEEIKAQQSLVSQGEALLSQSQAALKQAQNNVTAAQSNYDFKVKLLNDAKDAFNNGKGTQSAVDSAQNAVDNAKVALDNTKLSVDTARSQVNSASAQLEASRQKLNLLTSGATDKMKQSAQYGVDTASKNAELSKLALGKNNIASSASGIIQTINFKPGEYVVPGNSIATVLDTKNLYVKIYVPEKALPSLKTGKEVTMKSDFIEDKTIKGQITYISTEAEFTPMNIVTKKDRMKTVYAVKVKILDNIDAIKPGMLMDVNIE